MIETKKGKKAAAAPEADAPAPPAATAPRASAPPPLPQRKALRVLEDKMVSIRGCMTQVWAGQVLDPLGYDEAVLKSLAQQGVKTEEV